MGFAEPLRNGEFRALWLAELTSVLGDQFARVALALLVFAETSSSLLTALTYGLTLMPSLLGGMLLSGLADRFPRRTVMAVADAVRALLSVVLVVPGLPLPVLWVCVGLLSFAAGPFKAAQMAVLTDVLGSGRGYEAGLALRQFSTQLAQLAGFSGGGILVAWLDPRLAMGLNAGTFVFSAALVVFGVRRRPAAGAEAADASAGPAEDAGREARGMLGVLVVLVLLLGLFMVPEGLAAPYGQALGVGAAGIGLLLAADPVGSALGAWLSTVVPLPTRLPIVVGLAVAASVPLIVCAAGPGFVLTLVLWALSGAVVQMYLIKTQSLIVAVVPNHRRGTVMGRMGTAMYCSQGLMMAAGGAISDHVGPSGTVAAAGAVAAAAALAAAGARRAARSRKTTGSEPESAGRASDHHSLPRISGTSSREQERLADRTEQAPTGSASHRNQYGG